MELNNCRTCDNSYLAIRTDVYKDKRPFVYCDCCGAMADMKTWQQIPPKKLLSGAFKILNRLNLWLQTRHYVALTPVEVEILKQIREYEIK